MASPPTPDRRKRSGWLSIFVLAVVLLLMVGVLWKASSPSVSPRSPAPPKAPGATASSEDRPLSPSAAVTPPPSPVQTPTSGTPNRMLALSMKFDHGRLIETAREEHAGTVRTMRGIDGQPGLYHRIVDPGGKVLFENIVGDPRVIPYDTTDDGKTLRGGTAIVPDIPLQLRLPSGVTGRLEVYRTEAGAWTRATLNTAQSLVGIFDLR